jgi:hypothetical protein
LKKENFDSLEKENFDSLSITGVNYKGQETQKYPNFPTRFRTEFPTKLPAYPQKPLANPKNYSQNTSNFPIKKKIQNYTQHKTDENLLNIDGIIAGIFPNE